MITRRCKEQEPSGLCRCERERGHDGPHMGSLVPGPGMAPSISVSWPQRDDHPASTEEENDD